MAASCPIRESQVGGQRSVSRTMPRQQGSWRGCSRAAVFVLQPDRRTEATDLANIQLVRLDPAIEQSFTNDEGFMDALAHDNWARVAELVHERVGRTLVPV